jgi:serine/threonine protein kinase
MQLHGTNWLHKAFRGDNILFFSSDKITHPYLADFEYARDVQTQSIGHRPGGKNAKDYCYHPDVQHGYNKVLDLYSLGVVLLEIAFWRLLGPQFRDKKAGTLEAIRDLCVKTAGQVEGKVDAAMGRIYADVVRTCLNCEFRGLASDEEIACARNTEVVLPLSGVQLKSSDSRRIDLPLPPLPSLHKPPPHPTITVSTQI